MIGFTHSLAVLTMACLGAASPGAQPKQSGSPRDGAPDVGAGAARVIKYLMKDTQEFLDKLTKTMASRDTRKNDTVNRWHRSVSRNVIQWETRGADFMAAARKHLKNASNAAQTLAWWRKWSEAQVQFLNEVSDRGAEIMEWKWDMNVRIKYAEEGVDSGPKKLKALHTDMEWADKEIRDAQKTLAGGTDVSTLKRLLRHAVRVRRTVENIQKTAKRHRDYTARFFCDENKPSTRKAALSKIAKPWNEAIDRPQLEPCFKDVLFKWAAPCRKAVEDYGKAYEQIEKIARPLLDETLFQDLPSFKGVKYDGLLKVAEDHEAAVRARLAEVRAR